MKLFLILALLSNSCIALAQSSTEESLFPELAAFSTQDYKKLDEQSRNTIIIPKEEQLQNDQEQLPEEDQIDEKNLFEENAAEPVQESIPSTEEENQNEDQEDDEQQNIIVTINDIDATLTPNREASFCSANFVVGNGLKKEIKSFSGTFTIGTVTKKFSFKNIAKRNVFAKKYIFIGTSCEQITNEPQLVIESCQVEGWSEKKCKSKVQFVPLPKDLDTLSE